MCRLFGLISADGVPKELLLEFMELAEHGKIGADFGCSKDTTRGHLDGWGVAVMGDENIFYKEGKPATRSEEMRKIVTKISHLKHVNMIAHLRRASDKNTISDENAHPFYAEHGRRAYYFAHNGSIEHYNYIAHGEIIDSKYLFNMLMTSIDEGIMGAIRKMKKDLEYTALNFLLLSNGEIYAYRDAVKCTRYFTLYYATHGSMHVVCSEKLKYGKLKWKPIKNESLVRITEKGVEVLM